MAEKLISLKEAAEKSGYHPDYLGYLIRQGKLKGKKIGRNWFTTEKIIKDFLRNQKFLPLKDFLFSKPRFIFVFLVVVIFIGVFLFLFYNPPVSYQYLSGDFTEEEKFTSSPFIEKETIKEVKITTYLVDGSGETEVRAPLELKSEEPIEEKPSFFRQIIDFLRF